MLWVPKETVRFVWVDALHPTQQFLAIFLSFWVEPFLSVLAFVESQTSDPSIPSLTLYHCNLLSPFELNGISLSYQLDQSILVLRDVVWYFSLLFKFKKNFCKQTVENLIRCHILRLIWFCTVCQCPTKRTLS